MSSELNQLIHEQVMGFVWDELRCRVCGWPLSASPVEGCVPGNCSLRPAPMYHADEPPPYSTDIAAAWQVVRKMEQNGFWAEMRTPFEIPFSPANDGYWCGYTPHGISGWNGTPDHHTQAATLPLAICLAALAACGIEVSNG